MRRLGIDYAVGPRLDARVQRARIAEGLRRGKRLRLLGRVATGQNRGRLAWLQVAAVDPASLYGSDALSVSARAALPLAREAALALGVPRLCAASPTAWQMLGAAPGRYPPASATAATLARYAAEWWAATSGGKAASAEPGLLSPSELVRGFQLGVAARVSKG